MSSAEILFLVFAAAAVILTKPARPTSPAGASRVDALIMALAHRPRWAVAAVGALGFVSSALLTLRRGLPVPQIHDEFSYLLAGDTFAHGRATNPQHPLWEFFETFHVIQQPTYASKFPPGMGLYLAVGELLGHPIVGVWLGIATASAAITWMLQAWLPRRWALVGGAFAALHLVFLGGGYLGFPGYWSQTYWGGQVAATGGALLFGGLRRVVGPKPRVVDALLLGLGLALLAVSRPFEGAIVALPAAVILGAWLLRRSGPPIAARLGRVVLPIATMLLCTFLAIAGYDRRVTGDPLLMPYVAHERIYGAGPLFMWQAPRSAPEYRHRVMAVGHRAWMFDNFRRQQTTLGFVDGIGRKLRSLQPFYFRPTLLVALVPFRGIVRDRWIAWAIGVVVFLLALMTMTTGALAHYAAPVVALVCVVAVQGFRHLRVSRWRGRIGRRFVRLMPIGQLALVLAAMLGTVDSKDTPWQQRAALLASLERSGGRHVVVVRYGPDHDPGFEWVHNGADIDGAKVVWARDMGEEKDRDLLTYFGDRTVWLLDADAPEPGLRPYSAPL